MKQFFVASALLSLCSLAQAQQWLQDGDQWAYYVTTGWNAPNYGMHRLVVEGDTIVDGLSWKKLTYYQITVPPSTYLSRAEGDQVFSRKEWTNEVFKIYDFALVPGDTVQYNTNGRYVLRDTGSINVAGQIRRTQTVRLVGSSADLFFIEGIGFTGNPQEPDNPNVCSFLLLNIAYCMGFVDGYSFYFRCFRSAQGGLYSPFDDCLVLHTEASTSSKSPVRVWPNPANDRLFVQGNCRALQLCDARGRVVLEEKMPAGDVAEIQTSHLPNGMYLLFCRFDDGQVAVQKVVFSR
ncbi:MAG: T9SS type A sorting domain-containing protein [Lewinellaceae bacterium]|nr:T9SS type A sorting domain-containing protein [Lewinellaceae bacterium]